MKKIKIVLTFDHELPLGENKVNYEQSMFEPTRDLMKLAKDLDVKIVLFTDVLCALRFKEWDNVFYKNYINQLHSALLSGHDVQLHLHPHWLTTTFKNGIIEPSRDFTLSHFDTQKFPNNIQGIIELGCNFLNEISRQVLPQYSCIAYRGGGYNLAPNTDKIVTALYQSGIRFDSSICKGFYFKSELSEVDYKNIPKLPNWRIGFDGDFKNAADEGLYEIPIAGKPKGIFELPTRFKMKSLQSRAPKNSGRQIHEGTSASIRGRLKQAFSPRMLSFDNYTYSPKYLMEILEHHVNKHFNHDTIILSAIGHPKSMGEYSFFLMKSFIVDARRKYKDKIEFATYAQLSEKINK